MSRVPKGNRFSNIERFSGYEDTYDRHRPAAPHKVVEILTGYLEYRPELVVDVGCGTGLSTLVWAGHADHIVGIEPNDDMRGKAESKLGELRDPEVRAGIRFMSGYSNQLEFTDGSVDLVTCSQSFHWMEPVSTLNEVARILKKGGIFAAYDCDWPPSASWPVERAYAELLAHADELLAKRQEAEDRAVKRDKESHLARIKESGHFRYAREIVFHNMESCDAARYIGLALSQGGLQTVLKLGYDDLDHEIREFKALVNEHFHERTLEVLFSYRMRIGIK